MLVGATYAAALLFFGFAVVQTFVHQGPWTIALVDAVAAFLFFVMPHLPRTPELLAPAVFVIVSYTSLALLWMLIGSGSGLAFYFIAAAACGIVVTGIEQAWAAVLTAVVGLALIILLQIYVPYNVSDLPRWMFTFSYAVNTIGAGGIALAIIWYGMRQTAVAESDLERQYERSEALLENILPADVVRRLKESGGAVIADEYDEASVLMADIAGFTTRASNETAEELVAFLNDLYSRLDTLVAEHGLEKIKTSGDAYMVVSGVPNPRSDHAQALAALALDVAAAVERFRDARGDTVPLRIGLACGPVVAGVIGSQRFFYDVWGDAVNVASRMESTAPVGRIQVPERMAEQLSTRFVFEERGASEIKGKGVMRTYLLVGEASSDRAEPSQSR